MEKGIVKLFGERLKRLREAAGFSQAGLAAQSGVPIGTIRDYEQQRRGPLLETAIKLARAIKQPLEAFLPAEPASEPQPAKKSRKRKTEG